MQTLISGNRDHGAACDLATEIADELTKRGIREISLRMNSDPQILAAGVMEARRQGGSSATLWAVVTGDLLQARLYTGRSLYDHLRQACVQIVVLAEGGTSQFEGETVFSGDNAAEIAQFLWERATSPS